MPSPSMLMHLAFDFCSRQQQARIPEPELVMADAVQAEAFMRAGREDGILAHTYVYHALQVSSLIKPGDTIVDLGCGPATQLAQIARLNPSANFIGVDASDSMLELAKDTVRRFGLTNVTLQPGNMQRLDQFADASVDGVISTISLHHLADFPALQASCREARRILRPDGALYLVDFGRLKRASTQRFFAEDRKAVQPDVFTVDYFNSLRAAFSLAELTDASKLFGGAAEVRRTFLVPLLVVIKSRGAHALDATQQSVARTMYAELTRGQRWDLRDLARFFGHGGYPLVFKPW